jgi:hypothetical protein
VTRRWNVMLSAGMSQGYGAAGKEHLALRAPAP